MELDIVSCLDQTVDAVRALMPEPPSVGIVLGTGLGDFVGRARNVVSIPCAVLPHLPVPKTLKNGGNVCFGTIDDVPIVCLQGRSHLYEGYPAWQVVHGVRMMARLGVGAVLLTDSCGILDPDLSRGTMAVVTDHLDLLGAGAWGSATGDAFLSPSEVATPYDAELSELLYEAGRSESLLAARIGRPADIILEDGVYAGVRDPSCVTPAQMRMLYNLGAHIVGLGGLIAEVTALRELGVRVAALTYLSYVATPLRDAPEEAAPNGLQSFERVARAWVLRAHRAQT